MNLLRAAGRAALASVFIAQGVKAVKNPDALVSATEPLAERFVPFAQAKLPGAIGAYVPEDPKSIVRLSGVAAIAGGLGMATGLAPKAGGFLAAASMIPQLADADPRQASDRKAALGDFITKLALAGAALVVSQDTRGRPSLYWRAGDSAARLGQSASRAVVSASSDVERAGKRARRRAERAARRAAKRVDSMVADAKGVLS